MLSTLQVYSVQGTQFTTIESINAIKRAKDEALKNKAKTLIYCNGNLWGAVDRRCVFIAA